MKSWVLYLSILFDAVSLGLIVASRTGDPLVSPWQVLPAGIFLFFGLSSLCLYICAAKHPLEKLVIPSVFHAAVAWGLYFLLFANGFGLDPLLHLARERRILASPELLLSPLYLGQYLMVIGLHLTTRIPLSWINQYLLFPFVLALPFFLQKIRKNFIFSFLACLLVPLPFFTFTIPFHLAVFFLILTLFLLDESGPRIAAIRLILSCCSLLFHPLAGIPAFILSMASIGKNQKITLWVTGGLFVVSIPLLLLLYGLVHGMSIHIPSWSQVLQAFKAVFGNPFETSQPLWLFILHLLGRYSPWIVTVPFLFWKNTNYIRRIAVIGLFFCILLTSLIQLPGIALPETAENALRLVSLLPILLLPDIAHWLERSFRAPARLSLLIGLSIWSTLCFFFQYQSFDQIDHSHAPSLSSDDIRALEYIRNHHNQLPYAVVSSPIVAAAGLAQTTDAETIDGTMQTVSRFGVDRDGAISKAFFETLQTDSTESLKELQRSLQTETLYFILPAYWDPDGKLQTVLTAEASTTTQLGGNTIFLLKSKIGP